VISEISEARLVWVTAATAFSGRFSSKMSRFPPHSPPAKPSDTHHIYRVGASEMLIRRANLRCQGLWISVAYRLMTRPNSSEKPTLSASQPLDILKKEAAGGVFEMRSFTMVGAASRARLVQPHCRLLDFNLAAPYSIFEPTKSTGKIR
jgi:hypothetical protein